MWNGYMDGFLALYFAIAMLFLGKYINSSSSIDLLSGLGCLVVLLYIKNEGALALFAGLFSITLVLFAKRKIFAYKFNFLINWKYYLAGSIALLPFFLWILYKQRWNLSNDLGVGTTASFLRIINRLSDGSYRLILKTSYKQLEAALLLLGFLYFASVVWRKTLVKESYPALIVAGVYYLGMVTVYLLTPADLSWHLRTSIARTMLPINAALFVASYYILDGIERSEQAQ